MKTTKTVEVWTCDLCKTEIGFQPTLCGKCGKELCYNCTERYNLRAMRLGKGQYPSLTIGERSGYQVQYCVPCAGEWVRALKELGFRDFGENIIAV